MDIDYVERGEKRRVSERRGEKEERSEGGKRREKRREESWAAGAPKPNWIVDRFYLAGSGLYHHTPGLAPLSPYAARAHTHTDS